MHRAKRLFAAVAGTCIESLTVPWYATRPGICASPLSVRIRILPVGLLEAVQPNLDHVGDPAARLDVKNRVRLDAVAIRIKRPPVQE